MNKLKTVYFVIMLLIVVLTSNRFSFAGNKNRAGQAGASEILINPWARSTGWAGANTASIRGIEAMHLNIAGIAFTQKTEIVFSNSLWLKGSDIRINALGLTQRVGEAGVIGMSIIAMDLGDFITTTVDLPEGGIGTFSPSFTNFGLSYTKAFSNSIYGGITAKLISESTSNIGASTVALDAGIQYITGLGKNKEGKKNTDNLKFGISLKNIGPPLIYRGDGLSFRTIMRSNSTDLKVEQRSEKFELPSLVNIGGAYDYKISDLHRLTFAANFTSNSFTSDQYQLGCEYGFKNYFMVRGGYFYEKERTIALTGPSAGFTAEVPLGKSGKTFGIDYSFRATNPFHGIHSMGARITL